MKLELYYWAPVRIDHSGNASPPAKQYRFPADFSLKIFDNVRQLKIRETISKKILLRTVTQESNKHTVRVQLPEDMVTGTDPLTAS